MRIVLRIRRFDPDREREPHDADYPVEAEPTDRILDALIRVKEEQDGSLSFRRSCGHGVCGSDAMIIAGVERLACKTLVRDVAKEESALVTRAAPSLPACAAGPHGGPGSVLPEVQVRAALPHQR